MGTYRFGVKHVESGYEFYTEPRQMTKKEVQADVDLLMRSDTSSWRILIVQQLKKKWESL